MSSTFLRKLTMFSGLFAAGILALGVSAAMIHDHIGLLDPHPISYLGVVPATKTIFLVSLLLSAVLYIVFAGYLFRVYGVNKRFYIYFLIGQVGQIITALFIDTPHTISQDIHTLAAFTLAFSLPLLMGQFSRSGAALPRRRLYLRLLRLEQIMFVIGIGLFIFVRGIAPLGEVLPTAGFDIWVVVVTSDIYRHKLKVRKSAGHLK